ncbi:MAG: ornithine cyclodeaminase [Jatrophihabitantaceae bacterium]
MVNSFPLRILNRAEVARCLEGIDLVAVAEAVLRRHAEGLTVLPAEGYLSWRNDVNGDCRSLAMLGALTRDADRQPVYGLKVINAATSNPARGMERAGGIGMIFDPETARPVMLVEVGLISALRTAAYTVLSIRAHGPTDWSTLAVIGTGTQAAVHLDLIAADVSTLAEVRVYDIDRRRAEDFAQRASARHPKLDVLVADEPAAATVPAQVVVTATTSTAPYLGPEAFGPGTFIAHVSLDDLTAEALLEAEALFVDDVELVQDNPRRILGRLMQDQRVLAPGRSGGADSRPLDGTLGDVLIGRRPAIRPSTGYVVSNPFGMAVLDVGFLDVVRAEAQRHNIGMQLDLLPSGEG